MKKLFILGILIAMTSIAQAGHPCGDVTCDSGDQCSRGLGLPRCEKFNGIYCGLNSHMKCRDKRDGEYCTTKNSAGEKIVGSCWYDVQQFGCSCLPIDVQD